MSDKSQKVMKNVAIKVLAIVFVVFVILFFTGKIGDFIGITGDTSSDTSQISISSGGQTVANSVTVSSVNSDNSVISTQSTAQNVSTTEQTAQTTYKFRNQDLLEQHYKKHGIDMGFSSPEEYEKAAAAVPNNPNALHKTEKEDGDDVYYVESTNEFVIVSTDGYLRTYFNPDRGIDYYNKQ